MKTSPLGVEVGLTEVFLHADRADFAVEGRRTALTGWALWHLEVASGTTAVWSSEVEVGAGGATLGSHGLSEGAVELDAMVLTLNGAGSLLHDADRSLGSGLHTE